MALSQNVTALTFVKMEKTRSNDHAWRATIEAAIESWKRQWRKNGKGKEYRLARSMPDDRFHYNYKTLDEICLHLENNTPV